MNKMFYISFLLMFLIIIDVTEQHGYLYDPPARSSAWTVYQQFYNCCINYQHNQMFCGGVNKLWHDNGGKCGICGEAWDEPKNYEKGGIYYLGEVLRTYLPGSIVNVTVHITANHKGYFEFRLCDVTGWETDATQECLNSTILKLADDNHSTRYKIEPNYRWVTYGLQLPENFTCDHCVMQWKWNTGNSWGYDSQTNRSCVGCGIQEQFYGCSDVAIKNYIGTKTSLNLATVTTTTEDVKEMPFNNSTTPQSVTISTTIITDSTSNPTTTTTIEDSSNASTSSISTPITTLLTSTTTLSTTSSSTSTAKTTTSTKSQIDSTTSSTTPSNCYPIDKLVFGELSDLSGDLNVFCNEMCGFECKPLVAEFKLNLFKNKANSRPNQDLMACLETCPLLCKCDN